MACQEPVWCGRPLSHGKVDKSSGRPESQPNQLLKTRHPEWRFFDSRISTSSGSVFTTTGCSSAPPAATGGGGSAMSAIGYMAPTGPFSVSLLGGGTVVYTPVVTLMLSAGGDVNRMAISRSVDFHDAGIVPFASSVSWSLCGAATCAAGNYDVYVLFYQAYGLASPVQHLVLTYVPGLAESSTINDDKDIPVSAMTNVRCRAGSLIKGSLAAVYYCANDGRRYVFPNEKIYFSWYTDFSNIQRMSDTSLAVIPIGGNVTYHPGSRLIKIKTDPKVYSVSRGGVLRWVMTEHVAKALYGVDWSKKVDDLSDAFFVDYIVGSPISAF
jgi:hypothetical protein